MSRLHPILYYGFNPPYSHLREIALVNNPVYCLQNYQYNIYKYKPLSLELQ